jgi:hypothetical protein
MSNKNKDLQQFVPENKSTQIVSMRFCHLKNGTQLVNKSKNTKLDEI